MIHVAIYNRLKDAVSSGCQAEVHSVLESDVNDGIGIHDYLCPDTEFPPESAAFCSSCDVLLREPLEREDYRMIIQLLVHGAYPPEDLCADGYGYGCKPHAPPLKLAVESGAVDDVKRLLSQGADVNAHPRICVRRDISCQTICDDCDTPLMAAVRREDVAMMRLLIAHGANVSAEMRGNYSSAFLDCSLKTALLVGVCTQNEEVIRELVTSGADVNQSLGPVGTVLHFCYDCDQIVQLLVELGADTNLTNDDNMTAITLILEKSYRGHHRNLTLVYQPLNALLSVSRGLDALLLSHRRVNGRLVYPLAVKFVKLFLRHGARIRYCQFYLTGSPEWATELRKHSRPHSERFIQLLRAADTDFSDVRQRIASVDKDEWKTLYLAVLDQKLSQPLTLEAWCVISVRRQLLTVCDSRILARIEELRLPHVIKDRLKLKTV